MKSEIEEKKSFDEKMMERIRSSIGDLITDDELKKVVAKAVDEAFFKPIVVSRDNWNNSTTKEPVIIKLVSELVEKQVGVIVSEILKDKADEIAPLVQQELAKSMDEMIAGTIRRLFAVDVDMLSQSILNKLRDPNELNNFNNPY